MTTKRVVLADDHPFVRIGIRNMLQKTPDIVVVGEASDGIQALQLTEDLEPDVLLLDVEMPGMKGMEVAQKLRSSGSYVPILALSAHEDRGFILGMLSNGAAGYLTKEEVPETIVNAIRGVAQGERGWVSQRVAARIAIWLEYHGDGHLELSTRQIKLLRMLMEGKTSVEIASSMESSPEQIERELQEAVQMVRSGLE